VTAQARLLLGEQAARGAAERAEQRAAFLSEASALLDRSLDASTTLATLARLIVPAMADLSLIDVLRPDGTLQRIGAAHGDAELRAALERLRAIPLDPERPYITRETLRTGQPVHVPVAGDQDVAALSQSAEHLAVARAIDPRSWLVLPLEQHGRVLGAMAFLRCGAPKPFTGDEIELARALAERAAQAVENARLYGAAQDAIRARDDMLAVVSHDLRSPLAAIQMCAGTLLERPELDRAAAREILTTIVQSVEWMNRIIQDLLDIASIDGGRLTIYPQRTSVAELLAVARPSLDALAQAHAFTVITTAERMPPLRADGERVAQVLTNLVSNAAKYTRAGGAITLTVTPAAGGVRFSVRDEGSGIPADHLPHVFERFWHERRDAGLSGTGLGLAIAKGIVDAHGGEIGVESEPGSGALFWFVLPADTGGA
ncbi:MAG TPA: ATP-binding protein, partial [Gemmatimonadaceae bacterium]|nr:ATP-binding protein [Gemmatimonadaceae bacterium]